MLDNEIILIQVFTVGEMLEAQAKGQTKFRTAHRGSGRILGTRTLIAINMTINIMYVYMHYSEGALVLVPQWNLSTVGITRKKFWPLYIRQ